MTLSQYFRLIDVQALMSLRADASRYFLGYIWWILEPLLYVLVFYVVFNIILDSRKSDFLMFLMCGKFIFIWFSKSVTQASNSIIENKGFIGKIDISKTIFPMIVIQKSSYKQIVVFVLLIFTLLISGYSTSIVWLWIIPLIVVTYLMIVAVSFIGACLVCLVRDFSLFISLGMVFLMFTSGIFWDVRSLDDPQMTELILLLNPLAYMLDAYRQVLMYQSAPELVHLLGIGLTATIIIIVMVNIMRKASKFLAMRALVA